MEIHIRLAGVQLGPYSEAQVRQHIEDGLLSLTDSAQRVGAAEWMPLGEVLKESPEESVTPEEESPPEPASPTDNGSADEDVSIDPPTEFPELPKRAPVMPEVTHLPTRQQEADTEPAPPEDGALAKKTMLIGPTAPSRLSPVGQSTPPIVTTTPLSPTNQSTKKVSRAALVKALAQKTSPMPTKALSGLGPRIPPKAPALPEAAPEPKRVAPPSLAKALTAKTVPMRSGPAAPPVQPMQPTTAPLPTRPVLRPPLETKPALENPPSSSAASVPAKRDAEMVLPDAGPRHSPPTEVEVKTTKIAAPSFKAREMPAPPVSDLPLEPVVPPAPRRLMPKIILAWAALAVFMLYYVWSPYHASSSLRSALDAGAPADLQASIDFPAVRASLKDQIHAQIAQSGLPNAAADPSSDSPANTVESMLDHSIDVYVTPEGISALVNKSDAFAGEDQAHLVSPSVASKILLGLNNEPVVGEGLASVGDFVSNRDAAMLHLQFQGLGWKLKRIDLPPGLTSRTLAGGTPALLSPVVDTFLERGMAQAKDSHWKAAISDFTQVLAIDPQCSNAFNDRGMARQSSNDVDGAIKDFTQALTIDPQMATAYNNRGNARVSKNDLDGAIADFSDAVRCDPTLAAAYDSRGNVKTAKDDLDGAISDFTKAINIDPTVASTYSDRGFARQANGNLDGAIADYTEALALKPKLARAYFNRGLALQTQGNIDAAIVDFDRALSFDPKIADAYYYRGNAKSANHDLGGAIADYTQAITLNPRLASAFSNRGIAHQAQNELDAAIADYTQALSLDPKIAGAYFNRAVIEAQKNDLDGAIADTTQALYLDPKNAQAYYTRGFAKLTKGNLDGALTDLREFCDLAPRDHNADHARLYLWLIAKAQNSGTDADQDLSTALENSWNSAPDDMVTKTAGFLLGRMNESDYLTAASSPDAATDQAQHCEAWYFAGMKRLLMGDKAGALDAFQHCVATQQKDYCEYVLSQAEIAALQPPAGPAASANPAVPPATGL
jgi:tetratricopeptide (TPR) repeat protein